jgi:hypothetical protein
MAVTYYVALPFIRTEDGTAPGEAQECQSEAAAIRRPEGMSSDPANAGAVAFKRAGVFERAVIMVLLLPHAIGIFAGFTPFSRYGQRRPLL